MSDAARQPDEPREQLTPDLRRYQRQMLLPQVGEEGQRRLLSAHALLVGCGALGCTIADLLVRAGVGTLAIVDRDIVEPSNLQRQSLFDEEDAAAGRAKVDAAARRLQRINSQICLPAFPEDFNSITAERICSAHGPPHVLLDGTDNLETRYLLNDLAVKRDVSFVYGGAVGTEGAAMTVRPGVTPCLRCLFPEPPPPGTLPTCDTAGVLAPVATIVAACQAADALRILLGHAHEIAPTLLRFDLWRAKRQRLDLSGGPDPDCPCCGRRRFEFLEADVAGAASMCGRNAVQVLPPSLPPGASGRIDLSTLRARLSAIGPFSAGEHLIRGELPESGDGGEPLRLTIFADGRALVHGTSDVARARAVYARYVGA